MEPCVELSFTKFCKVFCFFGGGVKAQYFNVSGIPNEILVGAGSRGDHVQDHAILHAPQRGLGSAVLIEREVEGVEVCREGLMMPSSAPANTIMRCLVSPTAVRSVADSPNAASRSSYCSVVASWNSSRK